MQYHRVSAGPGQSTAALDAADEEGSWRGRRATSGSPDRRRRRRRGGRCSDDPSRARSTRSVNRLSVASSEDLRRVALAVRRLADIGKCAIHHCRVSLDGMYNQQLL